MQIQNKIAMNFLQILATNSEKEVERFLKAFLPGTPWAGKIKAVGGFVRDEFMSIIKNDPSIEAKDLDLVVVETEKGAEKATHFIFDQQHVQIAEGMKPHFTEFQWIHRAEYVRILKNEGFKVSIKTDGATDIYICKK